MRVHLIHLGGIVLALAACSDDNAPQGPDKSILARDVAMDRAKDISVDRAPVADLTISDGFGADRPVWHDAQFLSSSHKGWKRVDCLTCHPYSTADKPPLYKCASCHGGNGACNPNGASSGKKDHSGTSTCIGAGCHDTSTTHPNTTTYTQDVQCVSCHFAKRGGTPDC